MKSFVTQVIVACCCLTLFVAPSMANAIGDGEYIQYYHADMLGSPLAVTDDKGRVLWYENTEPYGKSLGRVSADGTTLGKYDQNSQINRFGYTGHTLDSQLSAVYMKARYYDPDLGRFYSNDPIGYLTGDPRTLNRYSYAANNPYLLIDPDGRSFLAAYGDIRYAMAGARAISTLAVADAVTPDATDSAIGVKAAGYAVAAGSAAIFGYGLHKLSQMFNQSADDDNIEDDDPTKRPGGFRKGTVEEAWDNAEDGSEPNSKACPTCGSDVFGNPYEDEYRSGPDGWDVDHDPKWSERDLGGMDRPQVLDEYNKDTRLRCQSCNRADNQTGNQADN